eukprot:scaffold124436_cov35-Tisochrysis_lutea.AAC.2
MPTYWLCCAVAANPAPAWAMAHFAEASAHMHKWMPPNGFCASGSRRAAYLCARLPSKVTLLIAV